MMRDFMYITLRQLAIFIQVINNGSTTQASSALCLSQSAVSSALSELETQLSVRLFDRVGKRLILNEYGRLLYPKAVALLEQAQEIEQLFCHGGAVLRLAASSTIGNYILPKIIAGYRRDFPLVALELKISKTQAVIDAVADCQVDLGFIEGSCHLPCLLTEPWHQDQLVVFAAPEHPILQRRVTLETLAQAPWILREQGSGTREEVDYLLLSKLTHFELAMELDNSEAIKHAVRYGLGISCLSQQIIEESLKQGDLAEVPLPPPLAALKRNLSVIHHRQKHISQSLSDFIDYCHQAIH